MQNIHGLAIPETLAEAAAPETTALVVYDMQIGILRQLPHGPAAWRASCVHWNWLVPPEPAFSSCGICLCPPGWQASFSSGK